MKHENLITRRLVVQSSVLGLLSVSTPNILFANRILRENETQTDSPNKCNRYPSIDETIVSEVVGVSHFNLDRLKVLVDARPELARATWDWAFGDWETAIGAASHVARKDIAEYLMSKGARPDIFTFAMLGSFSVVKSMIEFSPGVQKISGPHGISLLQHVKNGISNNSSEGTGAEQLISYLESLADADSPAYATLEEKDRARYLGDYKYGEGDTDGLSVKLNMRKIISLGKLGKNGGALYKIGENKFIYNGTTSVTINFQIENNKVISLTVSEPGLTITAKKI
jgi:hypothetical protein